MSYINRRRSFLNSLKDPKGENEVNIHRQVNTEQLLERFLIILHQLIILHFPPSPGSLFCAKPCWEMKSKHNTQSGLENNQVYINGIEWYLEKHGSQKILAPSQNLRSVFDGSQSLIFKWFFRSTCNLSGSKLIKARKSRVSNFDQNFGLAVS